MLRMREKRCGAYRRFALRAPRQREAALRVDYIAAPRVLLDTPRCFMECYAWLRQMLRRHVLARIFTRCRICAARSCSGSAAVVLRAMPAAAHGAASYAQCRYAPKSAYA